MAADPARLDHATGCLLGLAVGDALGTTLEFTERDTRPHHTEMLGGGVFGLAPGEWTDDTAMALALADSLITRGGFDPHDLMDRFVLWWRDGVYSCTGTCFDIGATTQQALSRYRDTGEPFAGATDPHTAGNGSLMRLAPVALWTLDDPVAAAALARDQSRTTHGAPQAVEACAFFVGLLRAALQGAGKAAVLTPRFWRGHPDLEAVAAGSWRDKERHAISASGYVIATLEAALWAVARTDSFEDALVLAVNLGGDADTVGAVTGQLAGALYGAQAIPERWLAPLAWRTRLTDLASALLTSAARPRPHPLPGAPRAAGKLAKPPGRPSATR